MSIHSIMNTYGLPDASNETESKPRMKTPVEAQTAFKTAFQQAINNVNEAQLESNRMTEKLVTGETENLHNVMISAEKASVLLQTTIEVRNKALEAYQEIMRMQV
ncbi:flagellar hook-basal body complex protein FliE [Bacillus piscicola]|uniref:flagellar hook-basal body complex protein FliE n=1 Tax=Bacillus piscicola TaxID=1632684 RepID=UPI0023DDCF34|nr:flagellar hook-basal body complex protein FliE [Bacillus piscicola]